MTTVEETKYAFRLQKHRLIPLITATGYDKDLLIARAQRYQTKKILATFA